MILRMTDYATGEVVQVDDSTITNEKAFRRLKPIMTDWLETKIDDPDQCFALPPATLSETVGRFSFEGFTAKQVADMRKRMLWTINRMAKALTDVE